MKQGFRNSILFVAVFLIVYFLFDSFILTGVSKSAAGQLGKVNKICNHEAIPQLAVFGSSVGEVGINTPLLQKQTNLSAYNFSIDGTRFVQYKCLIDELGVKNNTTKLVILTEAYFSLTKVDALTEVERYLANLSNSNIYNSLYSIQPDMIWKCRFVPAYKYTIVSHSFYLAALDGWKRYFTYNGTDSLLGFTPVYRDWEPDQDKIMDNIKPFAIETDSTVIAEYKVRIKNLQSKGINVMIVLPPVYSIVLKTKTDFTPLRNSLHGIAEETNSVFLDFTNNKICDNKSLFYNSNHLNYKGAILFSGMLADSINSYLRHPNTGKISKQ
jgi:hypothetical protein